MQKIVDALWSPEFIRTVVILLLTGGLTGFLVPQLAAALAERRHRKQKLFEAELTRQRDAFWQVSPNFGEACQKLRGDTSF